MAENRQRTELIDRVLSTGELPPASDPKAVGWAVYGLFRHAQDARRDWVDAMNVNLQFYNGDQIKVRKNQPNVVDNQIDVVVKTIKPRIIESARSIDIMPAPDADPNAVDALSQRIEYAWQRSKGDDMLIPAAVDNMLIEGGAVFKALNDVSCATIDPRMIFWTAETGFDDAWYVGDQSLMTRGEVVLLFGKRLKTFIGATAELEESKRESTSPPQTTADAESILTVVLPSPGQSSPIRRYAAAAFGTNFNKASRMWVIELWVRDMTTRSDGELVYPYGRIIDILVGADKGGIYDSNTSDVEVLLDRENPLERLYLETGRYHPYTYAPFETRKGIWSNSVVSKVLPLQRGLNDAWNTWMKNAKLQNNARLVISGHLGKKAGQVTNQPGEVFVVPDSYTFPANTAVTWAAPPSLVQHFAPIRDSFLYAIRNMAGVLNVPRGETEPGITAGVALNILDENARQRLADPARSLSLALAQLREDLAYIAQEFDSGQFQVPDDRIDTPEQFIEYDAQQSKDMTVRVLSTERLPIKDVASIMQIVAQIEAQGMPGELILRYIRDPRLYRLYLEKKAQREAEQAMREEADREAAVQGEIRNMAGELFNSALKAGGNGAVQKSSPMAANVSKTPKNGKTMGSQNPKQLPRLT